MALIDTIPALPIDPFSSPEFIHKRKKSKWKPNQRCLRNESFSSQKTFSFDCRYQFVSLKILSYLRVLSCNMFIFISDEKISARFIFHPFLLSLSLSGFLSFRRLHIFCVRTVGEEAEGNISGHFFPLFWYLIGYGI